MTMLAKTQARASATYWLLVWLAFVFAVVGAPTHAGTVTYVYTDAQGTPLAKVDANGNIIATFDYAPYGAQALGTPPNGPGYTGHVTDPDTGLVYMQARYYDPVVGRFVSVDPKGLTAGNVFDFNRYTYVNDNPIINIDPDGTTCKKANSGSYSCHLDGNTGKFTDNQIQRTEKEYTNTVNNLNSHPNVTVKVTVKGTYFWAKAGDVAKGLANAKVDTAPASSTARAWTLGGGLFATSNHFLNYTPAITIFKNAITSDRHGGTDYIDRDLRRTFAHEGIHTLPRENALHDVYMENAKNWGNIHRDAYNAAGDKLLNGGQ